ncbi:MAG: hypothetical protein KGL39_46795 [Patescibacteria group bacterium]|nr:hypothetical protein [Patescibacteria group bacterium]
MANAHYGPSGHQVAPATLLATSRSTDRPRPFNPERSGASFDPYTGEYYDYTGQVIRAAAERAEASAIGTRARRAAEASNTKGLR